MATIKSYTDISQSKTLSKILRLESADCFWDYDDLQKYHRINWFEDGYNKDSQLRLNKNNVCAWSLAALLSVLPEYNLQRTDWGNKTEYKIVVTTDEDNYASKNYDNPVDACVDMIIELHELNLL